MARVSMHDLGMPLTVAAPVVQITTTQPTVHVSGTGYHLGEHHLSLNFVCRGSDEQGLSDYEDQLFNLEEWLSAPARDGLLHDDYSSSSGEKMVATEEAMDISTDD